jgi:hypothetical protein
MRDAIKKHLFPVLLITALFAAPAVSSAEQIQANLNGFEEVPALFTLARGQFRATIEQGDGAIAYELTYSGLQGGVVMAHVHFAQAGVNGGIMFWLCGTAAAPGPAGTPTCPQEGVVTGVITAVEVVGPADQGIAPGDLAAVVRSIRAGTAYANVHSVSFPAGEVRGQIRASRRQP